MNKNLLFEGSYLHINGIETAISKSDLEQILNDEIKPEPVRLNDSWLVKFGFKQEIGHWTLHHSEKQRVQVIIANQDVIKIEFMFENDGYTFWHTNIDGVHVLQGLYKDRYGKMLVKI